MYSSTASISSKMHCVSFALRTSVPPFCTYSSATSALPLMIGMSSPGNSYWPQQLADLHLHQLQQLRIVHHVRLVHEHHDVGHAYLTGQQNVLAGLRHRAVGRRYHQDRAVHLRGAR